MASTLGTKRSAPFDDTRDSPKRPRTDDINSRDDRDRRQDRNRDGNSGHQRRQRSRSPDRERRGPEKNRGDFRDREREDRDKRRTGRPPSPPRDGQRERSPRRDRGPPQRDRSRDRQRHDLGRRDGQRPRSPAHGSTPADKRNGHPPTSTKREQANGMKIEMDVDAKPGVNDEDAALDDMAAVMGFRGFRSTKNTKVPGNDKLYGVRKEKRTEYRQYMNRVGGFNRPLSPSHE